MTFDNPYDQATANRARIYGRTFREQERRDEAEHGYLPEDRRWEVPSSAYSEETPDADPLPERCPYCVGGAVGDDICPTCWGEGKEES